MKFAVIPWVESLMRDYLFEVDNAIENPDNRYTPYLDMKAEFERRGDQFHTIDMYDSLEEIDWFLFFEQNPVWMERIIRIGKETRMIYCNAEPPAVYPWNSPKGYKRIGRYFPYIMTWNDEWIDNQTIFKRTIPYFFQDHRQVTSWKDRKLVTSISGNKNSTDENELYSERERVISYFEQKERNQFDFYGTGWKKEKHPAYGGTVISKAEIFRRYKFAICFENSKNLSGYITEKILDCFTSGIVPIYAGAPNIKQYIPEKSFIDYFRFKTLDELDRYLNEITEDEYNEYLQAADGFLKSSGVEIFTGKKYAECVYELTEHKKEFYVKRLDVARLKIKNSVYCLKKNIRRIIICD